MSTLYVDTITEKTSGNGVQISDLVPAAGSVVQVVQSVMTTYSSSTSSSWADVGLSASITPSSSSNKILVLVDVMYSHEPTYSGCMLRLQRDASTIYYSAGGYGAAAFAGSDNTVSGKTWVTTRVPANYLDSPASTSSVAYKIQFTSLQSVYIGVNRTQRVDGTYDPAGASTITLMEIAQ